MFGLSAEEKKDVVVECVKKAKNLPDNEKAKFIEQCVNNSQTAVVAQEMV